MQRPPHPTPRRGEKPSKQEYRYCSKHWKSVLYRQSRQYLPGAGFCSTGCLQVLWHFIVEIECFLIVAVGSIFLVGLGTILYFAIKAFITLFKSATPDLSAIINPNTFPIPTQDLIQKSILDLERLILLGKLSSAEAFPALDALRKHLATTPPPVPVLTEEELLVALPVDEPAIPVMVPVREVIPSPLPVEEPPPAPPAPPPVAKKTFANLFSAFLESKNILLGELLGGLLVVGGSIALVGTLWNTLEQIPVFPFLVLAAISWLLFGAGQYTLHRWKLESTSRGMLLIGIMLHLLANRFLAGCSLERNYLIGASMVALPGIYFQSRWTIRDLFDPAHARKLLGMVVLSSAFVFLPTLLPALSPQISCDLGVALAIFLGAMTSRMSFSTTTQFTLLVLLVLFTQSTALSSLMVGAESAPPWAMGLPLALLGLPLLMPGCKPSTDQGDLFSLAPALTRVLAQILLAFGVFLAWESPLWLACSLPGTIGLLSWSQKGMPMPMGSSLAGMQAALLAMIGVHLANGSLPMDVTIPVTQTAKILVTAPTQLAFLLPAIAFAILAWRARGSATATPWNIAFWIQAVLCAASSWVQEDGPQHADLFPQLLLAVLGGALHLRTPRPAFAVLSLLLFLVGFWGRLFPNPQHHQALVLLGAQALFTGIAARLISTRSETSTQWKNAFLLVNWILFIGFPLLFLPTLGQAEKEPFWTGFAFLEAAGAFFLLAWREGNAVPGRVGYLLAFFAGHLLLKEHPHYFYGYSTGTLLVGTFALGIHCLGRLLPFLDPKWEKGLGADALRLQQPALILSLVAIILEGIWGIPRTHQSFPLALLFDWLGLLCLLRALLFLEVPWFRAFQLAIAVSVMFLSITWADRQAWDLGNHISPLHPWVILPLGDNLAVLTIHPWYILTMGSWLAGLSLVWAILRFEARNTPVFCALWFDTRRAVDEWQLLLLGLLLTFLGLATSFSEALGAWGLLNPPEWRQLFMGPGSLPWLGLLFLAAVVALREAIIFTRQIVLFLCGFCLATYLGQHLSITPSKVESTYILWAAWLAIVCWLNGFRSSILPWFQNLGFKLQEGEAGLRPVRLHLFLMASLLLIWKGAEFLSLLPIAKEFQPFSPVASWAGILIAFTGWLGLALKQRLQAHLAWAFWLVMIQSGIAYLHYLLHSQLHDHAALVPGMQMMVVAGALFLSGWAVLQKVYSFQKPDAAIEFACLSLGLVMGIAILPGLLFLSQGGATPHAFTQEVGSVFGWIILALGLGGYSLARMLSLGMVPWRGLFLGGFAILSTFACRMEHREPAYGATIITIVGGYYILMWTFAFVIPEEKRSLGFIDLANLLELTGIIQGIGLFLMSLSIWLGLEADKPGVAALGLLLLSMTSLTLALFRCSDRHAAISFWLSILAGYFLTSYLNSKSPWHEWTGQAFFLCLACGSFQIMAWVLLKSLTPRWQQRFLDAQIESLHAHLPVLAWSVQATMAIIHQILFRESLFSQEWLRATTSPQGWITLPFTLAIFIGLGGRGGTSLAFAFTSAIFCAGWTEAVFQILLSASHEATLYSMAIIWLGFGISIPTLGWINRRLGMTWSVLTDAKWPTLLNLLGLASFLVGSALFFEGHHSSAWLGFYVLLMVSGQLFLQSGWLQRPNEANLGAAISLLATILLCLILNMQNWLDLGMAATLTLTLYALLLLLRGLIEKQSLDDSSAQTLSGLTHSVSVLLAAGALFAYWQGMMGMEPAHQSRLLWTALGAQAFLCVLGWLLAPTASFSVGWFAICLVVPVFWLVDHNTLRLELLLSTAFPEALGLAAGCGGLLVARRQHRHLLEWLPPWQGIVSGLLLLLALWTSWNGESRQERLIGAVSCFLIAPTSLFLAWAQLAKARSLRREFLLYNLAGITLIFQAIPHVHEYGTWPERAAWFQLSCLLLTTISRLMLRKFKDEWEFAHRLIKDRLPIVAFASVFLAILVQAIYLDPETHRSLLHDQLAVAVFIASALLGLGSIMRAIRLDEVRINDKVWANTRYTWGTLVTLVAMLAHTRLCRPEWFHGWMGKYWAFGALVLAMAMGGLGSLLVRRKKQAIAQPILIGGIALPLAPLGAFWIKIFFAGVPNLPAWTMPLLQMASRLEGDFASYASLWLLTAILWGWISLDRKSIGLGAASCLALLAAFWSLWTAWGLGFLVHPQLWLIPPAIGILGLELAQRGKLHPALSQTLRYSGLTLLYASSATELIIRGIGESVWLPIMLAFWSVIGVLGGIMFRAKAFLFFGAGFLLLDIVLMIWHAAVDREQTWVWWTAVMILGGLILAMFTLFEKRRVEIQEWLHKFQKWQ